ncbi:MULTISPECIES: lipopolysaccharide biosynthesis protein [unclassified Frankia]|uniref:lipopolysaccharide biosynthesis protein n=1 Tax=unclassified Frankia TaxID=2632575 RepID=UPI001EF4F998|nr:MULTISPECIES: hypothetical protein [unclassified Frankia]
MTGGPRSPLYRNGLALACSAGLSALLGAGYWALAAHTARRASVGEATALVSAMTALSLIGQLNLGNALTAFLPRAGYHRFRIVLGSYLGSVCLSVLLGAGFALVAPRISPAFEILAHIGMVVGFALSVGVWTLFVMQDSVLAALRRASWVPMENIVFNVIKFLLLLAFGGGSVLALCGAWIIPAGIAVVAVSWLLFRHFLPTGTTPAPDTSPRNFRRFLAGEGITMIFERVGVTLVPLLVVVMVGPAAGAPFALSWMIMQALEALIFGFGLSLIVEGAQAEADVVTMHRELRRRALLGVAAIVLAAEIGAPLLLRIFGAGYQEDATAVFRLLLLGPLPATIVILGVSTARAQRRIRRIVGVHLSIALLVPAGAVLLGHLYGVVGVGAAWLAVQAIVATAVLLTEPGEQRSSSPIRAFRLVPAEPLVVHAPVGSEAPNSAVGRHPD